MKTYASWVRLALALALPLAEPAGAQTVLGCGAGAALRTASNGVHASVSDNTAPVCSAFISESGWGLASANATVAFGVLKVDTHADRLGQTTNPFPYPVADASAGARWLDPYTINAPGIGNNKSGTIEFSLSISGFIESFVDPLSANGNQAFWRVAAYGNSGGASLQMTPSGGFNNSMPRVYGESHLSWNQTVTGVISFRFSTEQILTMELDLQTRVGEPGGTIDGLFGNSAYWGGITAIRDHNGNLLSLAAPGQAATAGQYTMSTLSGTDWHPSMVPVPEPSATLLMLAGVSLLLAKVRARTAR